MAAYGADKLNDPAKAEPIVQRMIQLDPADPANYFALAKIYEDAGVYDEAEKVLVMAKEAKPNDPAVYMTLAGYYNRQGQFDKTIAALEQRAAKEPNNPEAFHTIATFYWDEAYRDARLKEQEKKDFVQKGLQAIDHALQIRPDYMEAIVYKGLLLRLQANLEKDPKKQQELLKQANDCRTKLKRCGRRRPPACRSDADTHLDEDLGIGAAGHLVRRLFFVATTGHGRQVGFSRQVLDVGAGVGHPEVVRALLRPFVGRTAGS